MPWLIEYTVVRLSTAPISCQMAAFNDVLLVRFQSKMARALTPR